MEPWKLRAWTSYPGRPLMTQGSQQFLPSQQLQGEADEAAVDVGPPFRVFLQFLPSPPHLGQRLWTFYP